MRFQTRERHPDFPGWREVGQWFDIQISSKASLLREQYNRIHKRKDASDRDSGEDLRKRRKQAGKGQKTSQVEQERIARLGTQQNVRLEEEEEEEKKKKKQL